MLESVGVETRKKAGEEMDSGHPAPAKTAGAAVRRDSNTFGTELRKDSVPPASAAEWMGNTARRLEIWARRRLLEIERRAVRWDNVPERTDLPEGQVLVHEGIQNPFLLKQRYMSAGWNTEVIMQGSSHTGPTAAIAIGEPKHFPEWYAELSRWGSDVILRVHVDIWRQQGKLVSQPHIEPDPLYDIEKHLVMWKEQNEIRGPIAVAILRNFLQPR